VKSLQIDSNATAPFVLPAALGVADYLQAHSKPGKELFSLRNGDQGSATFDLAREFVRGSSRLWDVWRGVSMHYITWRLRNAESHLMH